MLNRAPNLATQVLTDLERRIYGGAIPPGTKVNESHLAAELGVSRGPIREACRSLESERIIEAFPQRGSFVRRISVKEATDLFAIREELSDIIARGITDNAPAGFTDRLQICVDEMNAGISTGDLEGFFPANLQFHKILLSGTGNARLEDIFLGLFKELRLFRIQSFLPERHFPDRVLAYNTESNRGHELIITAIRSGSAETLAGALRQQVQDSRERSFRAFARSTGGGEASAGEVA
ncbi:MAG: GntR family transcriptional regulator [Rhodospirillales bacterium]